MEPVVFYLLLSSHLCNVCGKQLDRRSSLCDHIIDTEPAQDCLLLRIEDVTTLPPSRILSTALHTCSKGRPKRVRKGRTPKEKREKGICFYFTRLWPAFGRQSLVGSSGGYTSHGYTSHASPRACGAQLGLVQSV